MSKPVLLTVDDDPEVLRAVERDLRRRYAERYRVLRADSGATAMEALRGLKRRGDSVALLLVDQRMPQMNGVEFLGQAMELFPNAKRVLLTAYADTEAAIDAINDARVHHYLLKPWDPPEEQLYPVLDDLLDDWMGSFRPPFEGVRVLGTRWSPHSYAIRDFLTRNQAPYQWIDVETAGQVAEVRRLVEAAGAESSTLPKVLFPDGTSLADPWPQWGRGRATTWTVKFNMAKASQGTTVLRIALAGADSTTLTVGVNGQTVGTIRPVATNALRYNTNKGVWNQYIVKFDASLMKEGANEMTFTVPAGDVTTGVVWDYVRLELNDGSKTYPAPPDNQRPDYPTLE